MNLENEMWNKLKAEIKSEIKSEMKEEIKAELKKELRREIIQNIKNESTMDLGVDYINEIRKIIKTELRSIIFDEKFYETDIVTYITSLVYKEYHYLVMLNRGLVKIGRTTIEVSEFSVSNFSLNLVKDLNLLDIYVNYEKSGIIKCTYEEFADFINFKNPKNQIIWNHDGRSRFTFRGLFALYENVYSDDFNDLNDFVQRKIIAYISAKFIFEGVTKPFKNVEEAFKRYIKLPKDSRIVK